MSEVLTRTAARRLTTMLYVLMRDELTPGVVERLVVEHVEKAGDQPVVYSNQGLAQYARELACRILGTPPEESPSPETVAAAGSVKP